MPGLLYPGVYLVESSTRAHSIEGVTTSTDGLVDGTMDGSRMASSIATPEWTDGNDRDPGVTTLEPFGWATESLACSGAGS